METIESWFKREVQSWRTGASICWTVISLPVLFTVYTILSHFYIFYPFTWISGSISTVFSASFVLLLLLLILVIVAVCVFSISSYTVIPEVPETRLHSLVQLLTPPRPVHGIVYVISGAICTWICCNVLGGRYTHLSVQIASSKSYMLNEYHLFLVLYGIYSGFMYLIFHYVNHNNYLQFNILQQGKFFQVRGQVVDVLLTSIQCTLWQTVYFYPGYWLLGQVPKDWIVHNLSLLRSEQSVDTVYGLLDIGLCYQTILLGIFLHFMWSYSALLYRVYSTEHHTFPIESAFDNTANRCLIDAMSCQKDNLVKYLGFLDLSWLSKNSMERRAQVFSLSQPGGHPHNWNKLSTACLTEIDALNQKIQEENWKVFVNVPVRQTEKLTPVTVGDTTTLSHRTTSESTVNGTGDSQTNSSTAPKEGILSYLKKKPFFSFFLMDSPDAKSRQLFQGAQLQIWAIEALANFATASYTEDKFGVVQRSLPSTLTSLLNLQENVEKYFKLAVTSSRRQTKDSMTKDAGLKYLLQTTLKSSLYKIVNTFGKHLMSLKLQPDATRKLKQFIEYKE